MNLKKPVDLETSIHKDQKKRKTKSSIQNISNSPSYLLQCIKGCSIVWKECRSGGRKNGLNDIHVHGRVRLKTFEYTGWPSSMPTTWDTNRSFGDRWSGAFFESGSALHRYPLLPGRDGEVGYYFLQIPLPRRSWWSCLADEWPRYPRDHSLVMPSLSWIIDQWTVSPAAKHSNATYSTCDPQPPFSNARSSSLRNWKWFLPFVAFLLVLEFLDGKG